MPKKSQESGLIQLLPLLIVLSLATGLLVSSKITTTKEFPQISEGSIVLGKEDENKQVEENKKSDEQQKEQRSTSDSTTSQAKSEIKVEVQKRETETVTKDGQKVKTKVEDNGTTKVETETGKLKLKYEIENGTVRLKAENEAGEEVEVGDKKLNELENETENELEDGGIKVATGSGKPVFAKNNFAAVSNFPLSVDPVTKQLTVTTPSGQKIVTVLPDQAVQNMLASGIFSKINSNVSTNLTDQLGSLNGSVEIETRNNETVYKVDGVKTRKLFGVVPVTTNRTAFVSTDTGRLVAQEQSFLSDIVDLISR